MNEISKAGHHMWKCDGLFGNVSVLQQFYKLIFDFEKLYIMFFQDIQYKIYGLLTESSNFFW